MLEDHEVKEDKVIKTFLLEWLINYGHSVVSKSDLWRIPLFDKQIFSYHNWSDCLSYCSKKGYIEQTKIKHSNLALDMVLKHAYQITAKGINIINKGVI